MVMMMMMALSLSALSLLAATATATASATATVAPGAPKNCMEYYAGGVKSVEALEWCKSGKYFTFTSELNKRKVNVFYHCAGDKTKPGVVLGHGWPTQSFDFREISKLLEADYFVCGVDYPGFGFSDKPPAPYRYAIPEHALVIDEFVTNIIKLKSFMYITHDEGDSVGFQLLKNFEKNPPPYQITHFFILNGCIYLPKGHISEIQKKLLSNETGPAYQKLITGTLLANGLGEEVYTPALSKHDKAELATLFDYQGGSHILHETIQYLVERSEFEVEWLEVLARSTIPATMIWGLHDPVAVEDVADYVWENYLSNRTTAPAKYFKVPEANHYIQTDHPQIVVDFVNNQSLSLSLTSTHDSEHDQLSYCCSGPGQCPIWPKVEHCDLQDKDSCQTGKCQEGAPCMTPAFQTQATCPSYCTWKIDHQIGECTPNFPP